MDQADEEPLPLKDIFGIGPLYQWPLPVDPIFEDFDRVMGYATPQRLLREQMRDAGGGGNMSVAGGTSVAGGNISVAGHSRVSRGGGATTPSLGGAASVATTRDSFMHV